MRPQGVFYIAVQEGDVVELGKHCTSNFKTQNAYELYPWGVAYLCAASDPAVLMNYSVPPYDIYKVFGTPYYGDSALHPKYYAMADYTILEKSPPYMRYGVEGKAIEEILYRPPELTTDIRKYVLNVLQIVDKSVRSRYEQTLTAGAYAEATQYFMNHGLTNPYGILVDDYTAAYKDYVYPDSRNLDGRIDAYIGLMAMYAITGLFIKAHVEHTATILYQGWDDLMKVVQTYARV